MNRFYKQASYASRENGFAILLDDKPVKTPAHHPLNVPTAPLAEDISREWNAQGEKIVPETMLLTKFANTAIDAVSEKMDEVRAGIVSYATTDLLFYRAETQAELNERQQRAYAPILAWLKQSHGLEFAVTNGVMPVAQPEQSLAALADLIETYTAFELAGLSSITTLTGSACLGLAVIENYLSAEAAWDAAHIDEDYQIEQWGSDDDAIARRSGRWKEMEAAARLLALVREPA